VGLAAAERLAAEGIEARVLHFPTVKPLDVEVLTASVAQVPVVVTAEEHTLIGGLGSAVAEALAERDLLDGRRFRRFGIPDVFPDVYGDQNGMMRKYGISAENIAKQVGGLLGARNGKPVRVAA